ncbi:MAG: phosphomannose isomerase type II C-terminal cupin domain [Candidatus Pacebacteria bacterium]|nr:phosphomannose isomerase type II C-terminal cupin domain [Candidatus Paceibacterota bacterium]
MQKIIVKRPWGQFEQFTQNEKTTVKVISINQDSSLSLQYHNRRREFWRILSGFPLVTIGEKQTNSKPGDEFMVEKKELHQIEAKDNAVQFLEIAYGDFDEDDIVRVKDKYGRV